MTIAYNDVFNNAAQNELTSYNLTIQFGYIPGYGEVLKVFRPTAKGYMSKKLDGWTIFNMLKKSKHFNKFTKDQSMVSCGIWQNFVSLY